jgi:hypothetical protein
MCTVTWFHQPGGYQLFANRDEKRTRLAAEVPIERERDGIRFVAPVDGDFGGTWIATNERGLSLCLVNGPGEAPEGGRSRGFVVLDWITATSLGELREAITHYDLGAVSGFTLVALEANRPSMIVRWNGLRCSITEDGDRFMPLVSSSFDPVGVENSRRAQFARMTEGSSQIGSFLAFHRSHLPHRGPYSTCMHRDDAYTVSFTWVTVTPSEAAMYYAAGPPCSSLTGESRILSLVPGEMHDICQTESCAT